MAYLTVQGGVSGHAHGTAEGYLLGFGGIICGMLLFNVAGDSGDGGTGEAVKVVAAVVVAVVTEP